MIGLVVQTSDFSFSTACKGLDEKRQLQFTPAQYKCVTCFLPSVCHCTYSGKVYTVCSPFKNVSSAAHLRLLCRRMLDWLGLDPGLFRFSMTADLVTPENILTQSAELNKSLKYLKFSLITSFMLMSLD
jgi:hypothetical protein